MLQADARPAPRPPRQAQGPDLHTSQLSLTPVQQRPKVQPVDYIPLSAEEQATIETLLRQNISSMSDGVVPMGVFTNK